MIRRVVGWTGELLVTAGVLVVLFVVWQLFWTDVTSERAQAQTVQELTREFAGGPTTPGTDPGPTDPARPVADPFPDLRVGDAFAVIRVPRFGTDYARPVVQGVGADQLAEGVGHYTQSVGPGQVGNFSVAGHRTTYGKPFNRIDTLRTGDRVIVETKPRVYVYEITGHEIVRPWQTEVIAPVPDRPGTTPTQRLLTMTSCHPKYSAEYRYVTHGRLLKSIPRSQWHLEDWISVTGEG